MNLLSADHPELALDAHDRIAAVNEAWVELVRGDRVCESSAASLIDRTLWEFVAGTQVRQLWEILFGRVRAVGAPLFIPMRADTASRRRVWDVELHPLPERGVRQVLHNVWTEERPAVALLDPALPRGNESLAFCSWCNRIQVRIGAWEEIEDAQLTLRIDATERLPVLQPAVCGTCKQSLLKTFPARVA